MTHLSSFNAVHYRGIDGLSLPKLARTNLITGANGIGKTALIEAMWLFTGRYNPGLLWNANIQRSLGQCFDPISHLTDGELELHGVENQSSHQIKFVFEKAEGNFPNGNVVDAVQDGSKRVLPIVGLIRAYLDGKLIEGNLEGVHFAPSGAVLYPTQKSSFGYSSIIQSTMFQNENTPEYLQRYSNLVKSGRKSELVTAIGLLANGVEDVEILTDEFGVSYLSVAIMDEKLQPLHNLGGGAVRLARLLLDFCACRDGILLSDELESGIHHSMQGDVWTKARQWMEMWNVQFFATTHSGEFVDAAIDAFADRPEELAIHKLFHNEETGNTEASTFTGEALTGARDLNMEVR